MADEVSQFDENAGDQVRSVEGLLAPADTIVNAIPENPQQALIDATSELSTDLGFPQDPSSDVLLAQLPDEVAGRLANVLVEMIQCNTITQAHFDAVEPNLERVAADGGGLDSSQFADVRACSLALWTATNELELALNGTGDATAPSGCSPTFGARLDVWPVLRFDGLCVTNTYANDYLLTVDLGGNDVYSNNVGSNMVDLNYAPASSRVPGARGFGAARGCQQAIAGLRKTDCVPAVAVLLDLAGTDTYGVLQSPDLDRRCTPTTSRLIRRMVTGGVGFLGVGILRDAGTSGDRYTGKTVSLGAGHIFGVGVLSDGGGSDVYLSVRNSQGFALVGGVGILHDQAGNDRYDYYMPPPITAGLPNQRDGAGGVLDDESRTNETPPDFEGLCDRIPRFTQGTGNVLPGSLGLLIDQSGTDSYRGAFGPFQAPGQVPQIEGHIAGSMGFGANAGIGVFVDLGTGTDTYTTVNYPSGAAPRGNNRVLTPRQKATGNGGVGLFVDR
ncbi:MAG TPA: hypothetical protein VHJ76_03130 [Actinomycetota bacterium]|nr:hypothetical protein [Actinomycetota bacterium]